MVGNPKLLTTQSLFFMENFTDRPYTLPKYLVVPLEKPIYGHSFAIRDKYIVQALKWGKMLLIRTPLGQEIIHPKIYRKEAKAFKKEYLIPGVPMTMWQRDLKLTPLQDIEKYRMDW